MDRRQILRMLGLGPIALRLLGPTRAVAAEVNAVDAYRAAIAALPARDAAARAILANAATVPLGPEAGRLVRLSREALDALERGAAAPGCDWGVAWTGPDLWDSDITNIVKLRDVSRLEILRARLESRAGRQGRAVGCLLTSFRMARDLESARVMIAQLIGFANEYVAIEAAGAILPALDRPSLDGLRAGIAALPDPPTVAETVLGERDFLLGHEGRGDVEPLAPVDRARLVAFKERLAAAAMVGEAEIARLREEFPSESQDGTILPPADAKPASLESYFLDSLAAFRRARRYLAVRHALLDAAILIVRDGPAAIDRVVDPTDGRPFTRVDRPGGFDLAARFSLPGQPVARLTVGAGTG